MAASAAHVGACEDPGSAFDRFRLFRAEGTRFGPELSKVGEARSPAELFTSILDPNATLVPGYRSILLELADDEMVAGFVEEEDDDKIIMREAGGKLTTVKKADIKDRAEQKVSFMPSGLQHTLSEAELVDLVAYLSSLK